MTIRAEFLGQAWVNDYAVAIDDGHAEWDATAFFRELPTEYRNDLEVCLRDDGITLDHHDYFKDDPAAPELVRRHSGPFDIYLHLEDDDEES